MRRVTASVVVVLLCLSTLALAQNATSPAAPGEQTKAAAPKKRGPVFRATKEQIKQAQGVLKQRGFYAGDATGKLDEETRAGLRKYQEAEGLKETGTLNAATLAKMGIPLTERQKAMAATPKTT